MGEAAARDDLDDLKTFGVEDGRGGSLLFGAYAGDGGPKVRISGEGLWADQAVWTECGEAYASALMAAQRAFDRRSDS